MAILPMPTNTVSFEFLIDAFLFVWELLQIVVS